MNKYGHAILVMKKLDFPSEAQKVLLNAEEKIFAKPLAEKIFNSMYKDYWVHKRNFKSFALKSKWLSKLIDEHVYTVNFLLLLNCTEPLLEEYRKKGISEDVYWNTLFDLKAKLLECKEVKGVWGTFVEDWFLKFYKLERFGLGRFQYEHYKFTSKSYKKHGVYLKPGDFVLTMHIPSHAQSLTEEVRLESYRKAYEFFSDRQQDGKIVFSCHSWLLYPDNLKILSEKSNLSQFIRDFEILYSMKMPTFTDAWRVFGADAKKPVSELPTDTSMQRAFAEWLKAGNKTGNGYGVIVFDGEKVLTHN